MPAVTKLTACEPGIEAVVANFRRFRHIGLRHSDLQVIVCPAKFAVRALPYFAPFSHFRKLHPHASSEAKAATRGGNVSSQRASHQLAHFAEPQRRTGHRRAQIKCELANRMRPLLARIIS